MPVDGGRGENSARRPVYFPSGYFAIGEGTPDVPIRVEARESDPPAAPDGENSTRAATCWCCGEPAPIRDEGDPWERRMDGYCHECSVTRCDTTDSTCTRDASRAVSPTAAPDGTEGSSANDSVSYVTALAQTIREHLDRSERFYARSASEAYEALAALLAEVERLKGDGSWAAKEIERTNAKAAKLRQELHEARCEIERLIAGWQPW